MKHSRYAVYAAVFALTLIWGNAFVAIKYALNYISPAELLVFRYVPASVFFLAILLTRRGLRLPGRLSRGERGRLLLAGLCGIPIYNFCLNWGEQHITAGMASLIIALNPGITYVLTLVFWGERWSGRKVAGLAVAFGGLALLVFSAQGVPGGEPPKAILWGALVTLGSPVAWACYTLLGQPLVRRYSSLEVTAWATLIGTIPILLLIRPSSVKAIPTFPLGFWLAIAWLVLFCTVIAFAVWYWALKYAGATEISAFIYLIPAFAILFGRMLLREPITPSLIAGGLLILAGISLVSRQPRPAQRDGAP